MGVSAQIKCVTVVWVALEGCGERGGCLLVAALLQSAEPPQMGQASVFRIDLCGAFQVLIRRRVGALFNRGAGPQQVSLRKIGILGQGGATILCGLVQSAFAQPSRSPVKVYLRQLGIVA